MMLRNAAFASSVVASTPIVLPFTKPAVLRHCNTQVKRARCVSRSIKPRVREMVEWSGGACSRPTPRKSRKAKESAARHAMPRSESIPSKYQQQPEVHAWRQARPSHDFRIAWLTLTFDEIVEVVLGQPLIQSRVEWVTGGRRKIRRRHPFPAAARGRVFPWTCAKCSARDRDQSCRSVHANGRVSCQSRSRSRLL